MQYYSTELKEFFNTPEACEEAEALYLKKIEEEKIAKEAVKAKRDAAYKAVKEAEKKYCDLRNQFIQEYGSYLSFSKEPFTSLFDLIF